MRSLFPLLLLSLTLLACGSAPTEVITPPQFDLAAVTRVCQTGTSTGLASCRIACEQGNDAVSCALLGLKLMQEEEPSEEAAASALKRGCNGGSQKGCAVYGLLQLNGLGVDQNVEAALEAFETACDANEPMGCHFFGKAAENGDGIDKDFMRALGLYDKACKMALPEACFDQGMLAYHNAELGGAASALKHFASACDGGAPRGCTALGNLTLSGEGGATADAKQALTLFRKACEAGEAQGCYAAGYLCAKGQGVEVDNEDAERLLQKACDLGHAKACAVLNP